MYDVQVLNVVDDEHRKIQLIGYFSSDEITEAQKVSCIFSTKEKEIEIKGYLLPGGQTLVILEVEKFESFIHKNQEIWIIINRFQGKLKKNEPKENSLLIKYLPNTIFYDL